MFAEPSRENTILLGFSKTCLASECYSNYIRSSIVFSNFIIKISNNYFVFLIEIKCF